MFVPTDSSHHDRNMPLCPQPIDIISCDEPFQPVIRLGVILEPLGTNKKNQLAYPNQVKSLPYHAWLGRASQKSETSYWATSHQDQQLSAVALTFPWEFMIRHQGCQERTNSASKSIQMVDHRQIFVVVFHGFPLPMVNWSHIQFLRFDWMDPPLKRFLRGKASRPWSVTVFPPSHAFLKRLYAQKISIQKRDAKMIQHAFKVSLDFSGFQFLPFPSHHIPSILCSNHWCP